MKVRLAVLFLVPVLGVWAQQAPIVTALTAERPEILKVEGIEILHVQKNIYLLAGGGANVAVQIGGGGVLVVDAGSEGQGGEDLRGDSTPDAQALALPCEH